MEQQHAVDVVFDQMIGSSPPMRALKSRLLRFAATHAPVLIQGETGAGKEVTAYSLHRCSARAAGPFVPVNCGAVPRELIEAELFGSLPGGYTGARRRDGLLVRADGGTLFLDEIGDLPTSAQVVLLRVLETGLVCPVGGDTPRRVDLRVLCATHRDLPAMVVEGRFREDLYHRLAALIVHVPPLRDRREDLPALARALIGVAIERFTPAVWPKLTAHAWPGNVRELRNVLIRALAEAGGQPVRPRHIRFDASSGVPGERPEVIQPLQVHLTAYVQNALRRYGGNVRATARALEVSPTTIYRYIAMDDP
ncbi:MAG: sigma-54-dependent Fis family transcriptional regulator [Myxococcales bacterium]|nr:sigma-54-dependent Fis family transcriptional regulator [Myxococcales bacterium]